jgi:hypothetical protein
LIKPTNYWLTSWNRTFGFLQKSQIKKKFQSVVHHHKNVVKLTQHHRLALGALPHDIFDSIISHVVQVADKKNLVPFIKFASDLFQIKVSHLYMPATNEFTLILQVPMVSNTKLAQPLRIVTANTFQLCHKHLNHTGCRAN